MPAKPRHLLILETATGARPFADWMDTLEGQDIHGILMNRLDRVEKGNLGDCHSVGKGVSELRIDVGPGYRVYFGQDQDLVILLGGGAKNTQTRDIKGAQKRWEEYNAEENE